MSLFDAIGTGLRVAGGGLSQQVYDSNAQQDESTKARDDQKKRFLAELLHKHFSEGTLSAQGYQSGMAKLGFQTPPMQQAPDYGGIAGEITSKVDSGGFLQGGMGGGTGGSGLRPDGTKPMDTSQPTGQPIAPPADLNAPQVDVQANKILVYSTEEINKATAEFASRVASQPGNSKDKAKAIKDFRDNLKSERKSLLDEQNKESEIKNRNSEIAAREREKDPAFVREFKYWQKMDPTDPGYQIMTDRITRDASGNKTAAVKEIEADLLSKGLKPNTPSWDEEFHARMTKRLDKKEAPSAQTIRINEASAMKDDEVNFLAKQVIAGDKSVMSGYSRSPEIKRRIQSEVVRVAKEKGYTPEHLAVLNAEYKGLESAERTAGTREAQLGFAVSELTNFIPLASAAIDKVTRTGFKPINQLIQAGEAQWSPEQAALVAANRSVINAFAAVASRGVPTVHSTEEAEKMLNTAGSPEVYKTVLKQLALEAKAAQQAPKDVKQDLRSGLEGTKPEGHGPVKTEAKTLHWSDLK